MQRSAKKKQSAVCSSCEELWGLEEGVEKEIIGVLLSEFEAQNERQQEIDSALSTDVSNDNDADDEREDEFSDSKQQRQKQQQQDARRQQRQQLRHLQQRQQAKERRKQQQQAQQEEHQQQQQPQQGEHQQQQQQQQQQQRSRHHSFAGPPLLADALIITMPSRPPSTLSRSYLRFVKGIYKRKKKQFLQGHSMEEFKTLKAQVQKREESSRNNIIKCRCAKPSLNNIQQQIHIKEPTGRLTPQDACERVSLPGCPGEHQRVLIFIDE
ncbi:hypothetical protein, conserved [Eimeria acervulina]|uniref:Uncharacterized protein n=1 Tax=Eimeria acervulina TaxID=5801 RepID=U6GLM9_EIMAC|nr:hypothetical protein, conserved [Eimeria acervulina]CDI81065.1 hypothetical protein, conserved [Eimeria acervulina]